MVSLYRQGKTKGGLCRCLGQEATAVGTAFALEEGDLLMPLIRDLGAVPVKGARPAWTPSGGSRLRTFRSGQPRSRVLAGYRAGTSGATMGRTSREPSITATRRVGIPDCANVCLGIR
jgi:TPP-dependent pyruvate/acetoin dehydrogenase alpha subunit